MPIPSKAYARAGVDIDLGNRLKGGFQRRLASTHGPEVLGKAGGFGGLFRADFKGLRDPVLVSSIDGVGTKLKLAVALDRHDTIGQDLVNHCVNDIAVLGARPLFFLDYLGTGKLEPAMFAQILAGLATACRAAGCALVGGETAQMPGIYHDRDYDLAGCIVGVVDRRAIIDGRRIRPGDAILGLPATGLHTNGYSLARDILFDKMKLTPASRVPGLRGTLGEELYCASIPTTARPCRNCPRACSRARRTSPAAVSSTTSRASCRKPATPSSTPPPGSRAASSRLLQEGGRVPQGGNVPGLQHGDRDGARRRGKGRRRRAENTRQGRAAHRAHRAGRGPTRLL